MTYLKLFLMLVYYIDKYIDITMCEKTYQASDVEYQLNLS